MKVKLGINELIIFIFLILLYQFYAIKFIYVFLIPGIFFLYLLKRDDFIETLILSFPLSLIFYVYPYFILTRAGLAINYIFYLIIPGLMLSFLIYKKKLVFELNKHVNQTNVIALIIFLIVFYSVYAPYSFNNAVPLTEASNEYRAVLDITNNIISRNVILRWSDALYAGTNFFYIYPPLTQVSTAFMELIPTENFTTCFNMSYTFPLLYMALVSFFLFKKLNVSNIASCMGVILIIIAPITVGELTYVGNATSALTYSLYPVAIYGFFEIFNNKDVRKSLLFGLSLAAFFLAYHFNFYFMILPAVTLFFVGLLFYKNKKDLLINGFYYFGIAFLMIMSWFIVFLFFNNQAPVMFVEGDWSKPLTSLSDFISLMSYEGTEDIGKMVHSFGFLFFYLGFIASFMPFRINKNVLVFKKSDLIVFFYFLLALFLIICEIFPFHVFIPLRTKFYTAFRYWFILVPLMAFGVSRLIDNISTFKIPKLVTFFVFLTLFLGLITYSQANVSSWLNEKAIVNELSFQSIYQLINSSNGRVASFGMFGPAIIPAINRWTNASMFSGYNFERFSSYLYYSQIVRPLTQASEDYLRKELSPVFVYNTFQKARVGYLLFFSCSENGFNALNLTVQYPLYYVVANAECITILSPVNLTSYIEHVVLSRTDGNKTDVVAKVMNLTDGYKLVFTSEDLNETYTNVVNNDNFSNYNLNSTSLFYNKINDERLLIKGVPGYIMVREAYFPIWHAFQEGKELTVFSSYEGFIIIKSNSNSNIELIALPHYSEYLSLLIYVISVLFLFYFFKK